MEVNEMKNDLSVAKNMAALYLSGTIVLYGFPSRALAISRAAETKARSAASLEATGAGAMDAVPSASLFHDMRLPAMPVRAPAAAAPAQAGASQAQARAPETSGAAAAGDSWRPIGQTVESMAEGVGQQGKVLAAAQANDADDASVQAAAEMMAPLTRQRQASGYGNAPRAVSGSLRPCRSALAKAALRGKRLVQEQTAPVPSHPLVQRATSVEARELARAVRHIKEGVVTADVEYLTDYLGDRRFGPEASIYLNDADFRQRLLELAKDNEQAKRLSQLLDQYLPASSVIEKRDVDANNAARRRSIVMQLPQYAWNAALILGPIAMISFLIYGASHTEYSLYYQHNLVEYIRAVLWKIDQLGWAGATRISVIPTTFSVIGLAGAASEGSFSTWIGISHPKQRALSAESTQTLQRYRADYKRYNEFNRRIAAQLKKAREECAELYAAYVDQYRAAHPKEVRPSSLALGMEALFADASEHTKQLARKKLNEIVSLEATQVRMVYLEEEMVKLAGDALLHQRYEKQTGGAEEKNWDNTKKAILLRVEAALTSQGFVQNASFRKDLDQKLEDQKPLWEVF